MFLVDVGLDTGNNLLLVDFLAWNSCAIDELFCVSRRRSVARVQLRMLSSPKYV